MHPWLKALQHDLVKRAVWPARDLRDCGGRDLTALRCGLFDLIDKDGDPVTAQDLWERLREQAPPGVEKATARFGQALQAAIAGLSRPWPAPIDSILALENAFADLARAVEPES